MKTTSPSPPLNSKRRLQRLIERRSSRRLMLISKVRSRLASVASVHSSQPAFRFPYLCLLASPFSHPRHSSHILHPTLNSPHSRPARLHPKRLGCKPPLPRQSHQRCRIVISKQGGRVSELERRG